MGKIIVPGAGDLPRLADVVVIGGGVVGTATAFYASRAGLEVVVAEKREALGTLTTSASAECFRAQFTEPENVAMMKESIAVFENFPQVTGLIEHDIGLHQRGYLFMTAAEDGEAILRERVARQRDMGLDDVELLSGDEVRRRFPYVSPAVTAATFRARDGWLSTHELTYGFAKGSKATFLLRTTVTAIRVEKGKVQGVETNRGFIGAGVVVVAAGPFSRRVAETAGAELPLTLFRRQKVVIGEDPSIPPEAPMTIDLDSGVYWRPEGAKGALLGWAVEEEPSEPMEVVPTDWMFPVLVLEAAARLSPFWDEVATRLRRDNVFLSAGQYTCTPDHKPIIGPHPAAEGLYIHTGYSGHGVMGCPAGARLLVDLILGHTSNADNPFRYERFAEGVERRMEEMVI